MKTNQLMKRDFNGTQITQRTKDSFFNATELLSVYNQTSNVKKVFAEFWSNQTTKNIYKHLLVKLDLEVLHEASRGKGGSTWMHEELLIVFYNWLNKIPNHAFTRDELVFCKSIKNCFDGFLTIKEQYNFDSYYVDIFIPELNLCIEFDEEHHEKQIDKDLQRQKNIEQKFNVKFIRHNINENYGLCINKIIKEWKSI